jgi:sarcosine oxidase delta subunit
MKQCPYCSAADTKEHHNDKHADLPRLTDTQQCPFCDKLVYFFCSASHHSMQYYISGVHTAATVILFDMFDNVYAIQQAVNSENTSAPFATVLFSINRI